MTPEHWQRVSELYHAVLEADPARRSALLESADPNVRREVESLLPSGDSGDSPLDRDVLSDACVLLGDEAGSIDAGVSLGPYQIRRFLGRGGMGEVWLAHDEKLGRDVAIKTLPTQLSEDPERLSRLRREARVLASVNHVNVAAIHGLEESAGVNYLVLELVNGETLAERLQRAGPMPLDEVLRVMSQVADALGAAHRKNVTHRDIKPANIKVTPEGQVKVLDFGLAKVTHNGAATQSSDAGLDSGTGRMIGTPRYMSPEQARGLEVDQRTDIWAFGCVLYELLTGKPALPGETVPDIVAAILERQPDYSALPQTTPAQIRRLIQQCLAKDIDSRLRDIAEAGRVIEDAREHPRWQFFTRRQMVIAAAAVALIATTLALRVAILRNHWFAARPRFRSIAVLPLVNLSGDPGQEYFADGMTESLITDLAKIGALKVIARTSVMTYKGTTKSVRQIATELGVEALLEGSALRSGYGIRITAKLIDATTGQSLWADSYDRDLTDVRALQGEIARAVAQRVRVRLTPDEQARLDSARPVNREAHNAYLQGAFLTLRPTRENIDTAQRYFELALEKDPNYTLAYAGLARIWVIHQGHGWVPAREAYARMVAAAEKALALDSSLAEVHQSLGMMKTFVQWDFPAAEAHFRRAIELDPNYPDARVYYARLLAVLRRPAEAMPQMERALELDPHNPFFRARYAHLLNLDRRYDEALVQARRALARDPDQQQAKNAMLNSFLGKGMLKEALEIQFSRRAGTNPREVKQPALRLYEQGNYREAARLLADLVEARWRKGFFPGGLPVFYTMSGQPDKLLEFWEWMADQRDTGTLEGVRQGAVRFPQLETNPRYRALLHRMGLPEHENNSRLR